MIKTIFLKELKDTLRDKRTLIMMIVIPVLVFPIIMNVFVKISTSFEKKAQEKVLKIGLDRIYDKLEDALSALAKVESGKSSANEEKRAFDDIEGFYGDYI